MGNLHRSVWTHSYSQIWLKRGRREEHYCRKLDQRTLVVPPAHNATAKQEKKSLFGAEKKKKLQMVIQVGTIGDSWRSARTWGGRQYLNPTEHLQMVQNEIWLSLFPLCETQWEAVSPPFVRALFKSCRFPVGENSKGNVNFAVAASSHGARREICETGRREVPRHLASINDSLQSHREEQE